MVASGTANKDTFWVNNNGTWVEFNHYESFRVKKRQNQASEFEVKIYDISTAQKAYFKEGAEVLFFVGTNMILKGRIQTIEYGSAFEVIAKGIGMETKLLDNQLIVIGYILKEDGDNLLLETGDNILFLKENRIEYTNYSAQKIIKEINSDILTTASSGIFSSDYGNVSTRFEFTNRLNALSKVADAIDYYWWISQTSSDDYNADYLNFASNQGETSSQKTFNIGSTSTKTSQEKDIAGVVNYVYGLGYGDGVNQLKTSVYAASTQSSFLAANISSTDSSISLSDATDFDATGSARIAEEQITYAGINANTLTGCVRGANATIARQHNINCYVEQHFETDSAQTGSSIQIYGLMDHAMIDKSIVDLPTLEALSSRYLSDRKTPVVRIKIVPDEPFVDAGLNIGDNVTVVDSEANISGDYRIVGLEYVSNYGVSTLEIEVSNKSLEFVEQMSKSKQDTENISRYMQGATNIYVMREAENCDASYPLNFRFYMPAKAIAINKIFLSFKLKNYRYSESEGITEEELTSPSVTIQVGEEGSETTIGTFTSDQEETNITDYITTNRDWFNIKFTPNKRMRIEANLSVQIFLESK